MSLEVKTPDDLRRLMVIADGGDPDAQQTLNAFLRFNNIVERSNLPTRRDVVLLTYLDGCSTLYFPNTPDNPFAVLRDSLATSFMAKGGGKSNQFVDLMKQTPSLIDLQTVNENKPSLTDRILRRGKSD